MLCRASRDSNSVTSAGGPVGRRASTITLVVDEAVSAGLRSSLAVHVMVIGPGSRRSCPEWLWHQFRKVFQPWRCSHSGSGVSGLLAWIGCSRKSQQSQC